jgi:hypothetical protein
MKVLILLAEKGWVFHGFPTQSETNSPKKKETNQDEDPNWFG